MLFLLALVSYAAIVTAGAVAPVRDSGVRDILAQRPAGAALSPLEILGPFFIENFSTELYLQHSANLNETGYPVRAVSYTASGGERLQWWVQQTQVSGGWQTTIHPDPTAETGIFVDAQSGNTLTIEKEATKFRLVELKIATYRLAVWGTRLWVTNPGIDGAPVTLQGTNVADLSQSWHIYHTEYP